MRKRRQHELKLVVEFEQNLHCVRRARRNAQRTTDSDCRARGFSGTRRQVRIPGAGCRAVNLEGGAFQREQAKGEFFTVLLRITNVGDDARSFSASSQHLIVNGNKYDASSSISDEHWMEDINPGFSIDGKVTFDIPPGATPEAIEVHDSMFSGGAKVRL
jgi:hypothetical protein